MVTRTAKMIGGKWSARIPEFARRMGEAARAQRVVLFGSAARGEMTEHSDLDFLVVIPDSLNRDETANAWKRAYRATFHAGGYPEADIDILVATESRVRRLRDCPYGPIKFALDEGVEVWHAG